MIADFKFKIYDLGAGWLDLPRLDEAAVVELADTYGSGPYESNLVRVQLPPAAPFVQTSNIPHK